MNFRGNDTAARAWRSGLSIMLTEYGSFERAVGLPATLVLGALKEIIALAVQLMPETCRVVF